MSDIEPIGIGFLTGASDTICLPPPLGNPVIGDPVAIAATVLIAARATGGSVSLLKFDRIEEKYEAYKIEVNFNGFI